MNSWSFTGNLGKDCEQRYTPSGDPVVTFSVAVKSGYGEREQTTWARCQMWGKRGEAVAPYLTKGQQVGVVGEVTMREWDDNNGQKRQSLEVRVNDLTLLGKRDGGQDGGQQRTQSRQQPQAAGSDYQRGREGSAPQRQPQGGGGSFADMDDDIPF